MDFGIIGQAISGILSPIKDVINKREDRRQAHETLRAQLNAQQETDSTTLEVERDHLESVMQQGLGSSWKDEYATVTVLGIINAVILGGILTGFGHPEFMTGVALGIKTLVDCGVDVGMCIMVTLGAAIGIRTFKSFF